MGDTAVGAQSVFALVNNALSGHEWQDALDAARGLSFEDAALEADRLDLEAEAAWWLGRLEDCIVAREAAYRIYDDLGNNRRAGQCAVWLWEHHAICGRPSMASGWLRRARRALDGDSDCVEYGNLLLREAETAHGAGNLARSLELTTSALDLGRRLRSTDLEAESLQTKGRILIDQGDIDEGMGCLDEAMLLAVEGRLRPFSTGKVYCSLIAACEAVGDFDRAAEWTEATMRWAREHPFAIWPGICRVHRAIVLKRRGALREAEREAMQACEELRQSHVANSAAAWAEVGDIRRRLGQFEKAEEAFARSQELGAGACGGLALLRLAQGQVEEAMSMIKACLESNSNPLGRAGQLVMLVQIAVAAGDLDGAHRAQAELATITDTFGTPDLIATERSACGRLQLAERDPDACETLKQAADQWHRLNVPYEEATARTLLGEALRTAGADVDATESFTDAARLFEQIGAQLDALDRRDDDLEPDLPAGLTEREVEVLRLVAEGLTNNEIAGQLFLSPKTVSRHLSNIFTKIDVSSRASATAYAATHNLLDREA